MRYQVCAGGGVVAEYAAEQPAIDHAIQMDETQYAEVVAIVQSGTYQSRTRVWPTVGETRSN